MSIFDGSVSLENQGKINAIRADALDRIKYLAINGSGISNAYKVGRITEIALNAETEVTEIIANQSDEDLK